MKNFFLAFLFILGTATVIDAQSVFALQPIPASDHAPDDQGDVPVEATIRNLSDNTIHLQWERRVIELTSTCETAVCDPNTCYGRGLNSMTFDMDPHLTAPMLVHFYNNGAPCAGIIHLKITNLDNPADSLIGIYMFNQSSGVKNLPIANIKLFPNPATDFFSLENTENVAAIRVFSLDGRQVARFDASTGNNIYSLQNQPTGNYILVMEDKNGDAFQAVELHKR